MTDEQHALTLRISVKMYEPLRAEAFDRRVPISEVIREAVDAHLARRPAVDTPAASSDASEPLTEAEREHQATGGNMFCTRCGAVWSEGDEGWGLARFLGNVCSDCAGATAGVEAGLDRLEAALVASYEHLLRKRGGEAS